MAEVLNTKATSPDEYVKPIWEGSPTQSGHPDFAREKYLSLAPEEFRAYFRQRIHVSLQKDLFWVIHNDKKLNPKFLETARKLISIWQERGLPLDAPDYLWGVEALEIAENWVNHEIKPDFSQYASYRLTESELTAFDKVIAERRSVRTWNDRRVSDETIDLLLRAGSLAAISCNHQATRYIVVREENAPDLVSVNIPQPGPVHILIFTDERLYNPNAIMPVKNRLLDVGAVAQNILLTAHAHGLASVWLTHSDPKVKQLEEYFREHHNLEEWHKLITYINIGYSDVEPPTVKRLNVEDTVLARL